jgi:hypothetical protein
MLCEGRRRGISPWSAPEALTQRQAHEPPNRANLMPVLPSVYMGGAAGVSCTGPKPNGSCRRLCTSPAVLRPTAGQRIGWRAASRAFSDRRLSGIRRTTAPSCAASTWGVGAGSTPETFPGLMSAVISPGSTPHAGRRSLWQLCSCPFPLISRAVPWRAHRGLRPHRRRHPP